MRPEPALFTALVVSRPSRPFRYLPRAFVMVLVASGYLATAIALILIQLFVVEMMPPPKAVTGPVIIFHPPPAGGRSSAGERHSNPAGVASTPTAVTPPAIHPPAPLPVVVPLPPPVDDRRSESEVPINPGADSAGPAGTGPGGGGADPDGIGPTGRGDGRGCPTCAPGGFDRGPGPEIYPDDTQGIVPPVVIPSTRALPKYPDLARRAGVQGSVILLVVIGADGRVGEIQVLTSPDPRFGFDLAAIEAVKQWRYSPAMLGRRPVAVQASVMVEFTLSR